MVDIQHPDLYATTMHARRQRSMYLGVVVVFLIAVFHVNFQMLQSSRTLQPDFVSRVDVYNTKDQSASVNEKAEYDSSKPNFILHIGPPKVSETEVSRDILT